MAAVNGTHSFSTSVGGHTVTVTNASPVGLTFSPFPQDVNTGFTVSGVTYTTLAADWHSVGMPLGFTPNVGMSFVATSTGSALGSGTVKVPSVSGITSMEVIGDANQSIDNSNIASYNGAQVLVQMLSNGVPTAPAPGSVVAMSFFFDGSNVTVDGL
jgi:hypothetical protein